MYAGEVHDVAAGYARNYLIPKKMAVYATAVNFERCGLIDPEITEKEEAAQQLGDDVDEDLRAADVLKKYLRNKSVRIIRNVDLNLPNMCHPGHVNAQNLRDKLSKQLKIDLKEGETIHIRNEPILGLDDKHEAELMQLIKTMDEEDVLVKAKGSDGDDATEDEVETKEPATGITAASEPDGKDCDTKIKQLGDYVAKITLAGGYIVPLKFRWREGESAFNKNWHCR